MTLRQAIKIGRRVMSTGHPNLPRVTAIRAQRKLAQWSKRTIGQRMWLRAMPNGEPIWPITATNPSMFSSATRDGRIWTWRGPPDAWGGVLVHRWRDGAPSYVQDYEFGGGPALPGIASLYKDAVR